MAVYGFKDKSTAEAAKAVALSRPPNAYAQMAQPGQGMAWIVKIPVSGLARLTPPAPPADPDDEGTPGEAVCEVFALDKDNIISAVHYLDNAGAQQKLTIDVYNVTSVDIPKDTLILAHQVGGKFCITNERPVTKIQVQVQVCIKYATSTATGHFGTDSVPDWQIDGCAIPPEAVDAGAGNYTIEFENPHKLTAIVNAIVTLERQVNCGAGDNKWNLVQVGEDDQIARWVKTQDPQNGVLLNATFFEGGDPTSCTPEPTVTCAFDCSCLDAGDFGEGYYHPESDTYRIISTDSALMGPGTTLPIMNSASFNGCSIDYVVQPAKVFCAGDPSLQTITMPTGLINSFSYLYASGSSICASWTPFVVPVCGVGSAVTQCIDICELLCLCEVLYSQPEICEDPKPDCNCEDCFFATGVTNVEFNDGTNGYASVAIFPNTSDPCCWSAEFDDSGTPFYLDACYTGGGNWTLTGDGPLGAVSMSGTGDCTGASVSGTGGTGVISADGVECDVCDSANNCEECCVDGAMEIRQLGGDAAQLFAVGQNGPSVVTGPCVAEVPIGIIEFDPIDPEIVANSYDDIATVTYLGGGSWTVEIADSQMFNYTMRWTSENTPCNPPTTVSCLDGICNDNETADFENSCLPCAPPAAPAMLESIMGEPLKLTQAISKSAPVKAPKKSSGLGDEFLKENPELSSGCRCKQEVRHVMNRWSVESPPTDQSITIVSGTIANKIEGVDVTQMRTTILEFLKSKGIK